MSILNKISLWGVVAVFAYLASVWALFQLASDCYGLFCGAVIVVAIMPWSILFEDGISLQFLGMNIESDNMIWFWVAVLLNIFIIYFVSSFLQKLFSKKR